MLHILAINMMEAVHSLAQKLKGVHDFQLAPILHSKQGSQNFGYRRGEREREKMDILSFKNIKRREREREKIKRK